jgi:FdhD protein
MRRIVEAVPEEPIRLRVNGHLARSWSGSPVALEALAAGALLAAGFVRDRSDIAALRITTDGPAHLLDAEVEPVAAEAGFADSDHRRSHGCGLRFLVDCRPDRLPPRASTGTAPSADRFAELFRELFDRSPSRRESGGHHTAALSDGAVLLHVHEEVSRHNGVDKAIGAALLDGAQLPALGLLTTARISGEIAEKAARAGLVWVASRSVPTTLAVQVAQAAGLALFGRAASPESRRFP